VKRAAVIGVVVAAAALWSCGSDDPSGDVVISADSVPPGTRAVLISVKGAATAAVAPAGTSWRVIASVPGDSLRVAVVAPAGATLTAGPLVRLSVPDRGAAARYIVSTVQAADTTYALIPPSVTLSVLIP
jgi:hypothetical protein